jgi:uncharacterized integral membrane protein
MKIQWTLIFALAFALLTAIFAVINVEPVRVNFLFAETNTPLILVILTSTLLGGLIVGLFGIIRQYRQQRKIRGLERRLQELGETAAGTGAGAGTTDSGAADAGAVDGAARPAASDSSGPAQGSGSP